MTKAEEMRKKANLANENARAERLAEIEKYVDKRINGKIDLCATFGKTNCKIKVPKKFSPSLVCDCFVKNGFEVDRKSRNGRAILIVKW